jgi:hypothetical protein
MSEIEGGVTPKNYSESDVIQALKDLPEELSAGVIQRLHELHSKQHELSMLRKTQFRLAELAIAAHQNVVDTEEAPDGLDVIMWDRFANDTAEALVYHYRSLSGEQRGMLPQSALDWALYRYIKHELTAEESEADIDERLEPIGVTVSSVYQRSLELMIQLGVSGDRTLEELQTQMPTPYDFAYELIYSANEFDKKLENKMRSELTQAGYDLPELMPDNSYGHNTEDDTYLIPQVNEFMLPAI